MNKNYVKEMTEAGYGIDNISDFQRRALLYLGENYFLDKESKILDLGAGNGHSIFPLKIAGWENLWAVDIDGFNKNFFQKNGIIFNIVDIESEKLPFKNLVGVF